MKFMFNVPYITVESSFQTEGQHSSSSFVEHYNFFVTMMEILSVTLNVNEVSSYDIVMNGALHISPAHLLPDSPIFTILFALDEV